MVRELSQLGAEVLFTGRNRADLQLALDDLDDTMHLTHFLQGDISISEHREEVLDWISRRWGKLDILVNNAGINMRKPTNDYSIEEYMTVIGTDLLAPFELSRLLYPLLKKSEGASVINIGSVAGKFDVKTGAPYGMAKAGLIQLTRCLAAEWAPDGIRTNSVSPWFTETPLTKPLLAQADKLEHIKSRTPLNRVAKDEEIAAAVAFLAMDKASFITGQDICVDGGVTTGLL